MAAHDVEAGHGPVAIPPVVDQNTWEAALAELRTREKAATPELDAIAAARRCLPMVALSDYTLEGADARSVWRRCSRASVSSSSTATCGSRARNGSAQAAPGSPASSRGWSSWRLDAGFVIVTQGPLDEALADKARVGNEMAWYSTANSSFGTDLDAPPGGGFQVNVSLQADDTVDRTSYTRGRGTEQPGHRVALLDLLPYGRQEDGQASPDGWPQSPTYSPCSPSEAYARDAEPG